MKRSWVGGAEWLIARFLPHRDRESVIGDLREELADRAPGRAFLTLVLGLGIATRVHAEVYRDSDRLLRLLGPTTLGLSLVWAVGAVGDPALDVGVVYGDPMSRWVATLWAASHLTGAFASGFIVGHAPLDARNGGVDRIHAVGWVATGAALAAGGWVRALAAVSVVVLAALIGYAGRDDTSVAGGIGGLVGWVP